MLNNQANIYVSIGEALRRGSDESNAYRRQRHTFMISVEAHRFHIPGTPHHDAVLTHFEAVKDMTTGNYGIAKYSSKDGSGMLGNVLIAQSAHTSVDKVHKIISEKLAKASQALKDGDSYADEDEHWVRAFVHALQEQDAVVTFNMDEFITWLHGYLADRVNDQAPALVTYPRAHKDNEQTPSKRRSWVIHPTSEKTRTNSRGEGVTPGDLK